MKIFLSPLICLVIMGLTKNAFAQPKISAFSPLSGPVGTIVTISGSNFSSSITNNIVRFGAVKANISNASPTQLNVIVPVGATYDAISVTTNNLTAYSNRPFVITFAGPTTFDINSFAPKVDFATGINSNPHGVSVGDFDEDGRPDLAVANLLAYTLAIFRNTSTAGTVSFAPPIEYPTGARPNLIDVKDLDGDGRLDVAVANNDDSSVSVYRNTSTAGIISFSSKVDYKVSANCLGVALGDLDGDGKADILATNYHPGGISVFRNTSISGSISFGTKVDYSGSQGARTVAIGDLDGDDKPDVAIANEGSFAVSSSISIFKNTSITGAISFAAKQDYATEYFTEYVSLGDLDGDGKTDMAVASTGAALISVYRNTSTIGSILFAPKVNFPTEFQPACVSITDFNGDGKVDLAVTNYNTNGSVSVFKNISTLGNISFAGRVNYSTGNSPPHVTSGDLDGDGLPDIAVSNNLSHSISILTLKGFRFIPQISIGGTTTFCTGGSVTLTSSAPANNQWYKDGTAISGAIANTLTVSTSGTYTVKTTTNGIITSSDTNVVVTIVTSPATPGTITGTTPQCRGTIGQTYLISAVASATSYTWAVPTGWSITAGQGTTAITVTAGTTSENGNITVTATNSCGTSVSSSLAVTVVTVPTPFISRNANNTLSSSAATGNQWYLNGILIAGATNQTYQPIQTGSYTVSNTLNGCKSDFSAPYNFTLNITLNLGNGQYINVYPNPVKNQLNLNWNIVGLPLLNIQVFDVLGKQMLLIENIHTGTAIEVSQLPQAIYFIKIYDPGLKINHTIKILKGD